MVEESEVTVAPPESATATLGCVPNADPPVAAAACTVIISFDAAPRVTTNVWDVEVSAELVNCSVICSLLEYVRPANVATPRDAVACVVPVREPVPAASATVTTVVVSVATLFSPLSRIAMAGCGLKAAPDDPLAGVSTESFLGGPMATSISWEMPVRPAEENSRETRSALSYDKLAKVAMPEAHWTATVPLRVPVPPLAVAVTLVDESATTVLPPASLTAITGWVPKTSPPCAFAAFVTTASLALAPTVTVRDCVTDIRTPEAKVSVIVSA
mmetsp:Transcript_11959/g.27580  ORF Transcript_11959/g.27580 Transcript_11959/m.27580 type:complete len:272 (-) Transcript_11959:1-816(-)